MRASVRTIGSTRDRTRSRDTLFAIRWDYVPKQAAQAALRNLAGVLFTFLDMRKQQRYGYPDGYYYYGDHGYEKEA